MKFNFNSINFPRPYIIAEIGVNHECSIKNAYNLLAILDNSSDKALICI